MDSVSGLRPMEAAPKDGTWIVAMVGGADDRWEHLNGRAFVVKHGGMGLNDYDLGWNLYPGMGGIPDAWFSGWFPLAAAPPPPAEAVLIDYKQEPEAPALGVSKEGIIDAIKVAMSDAWADICEDSGCFPADIRRVGRGPLRLEYRPAIWTDQTAEMAAQAILAAKGRAS